MYVALLLSAVLSATAVPPAQRLAEARQLVDDLQYDKALKVIDAAFAQGEVDHDTLVSLYELAAISYATLEKPGKAKEAFQALLSIAPDYQLSKNLPPRTRTPFFEAKTWLGNTTAVSCDVQPVRDGEALKELAITVKDNALVVAKSLRVTLSVPGKPDDTKPVKLEGKRGTVAVGGAKSAKWKVEVLGDRGVLNVTSGEAKPPEVAVALPPPPPPPLPVVVEPAPASRGWMRPTGIALGAVGAAALIGGGVFGWLSADARAKVAKAERNMAGVVVGITQKQAAEYDAAARTNATIANALFIAGGVLAASGVGFIIFGGSAAEPSAPAVSLLFSPLGPSLSGRF